MSKEIKKPENPKAFPSTRVNAEGIICGPREYGMTLRDYFANSAMQAHLSTDYGILHNSDSYNDSMLAKRFYEFADSMLKQREL